MSVYLKPVSRLEAIMMEEGRDWWMGWKQVHSGTWGTLESTLDYPNLAPNFSWIREMLDPAT